MTIQGKLDKYTFDPESKSSILRANGKFGSTYIGKRNSDGRKVIIKKIISTNKIQIKRFSREAEINIEHPNLVRPIEYFSFENEHYLIREFIPGTDLKIYSKNKKLSIEFFIQCGIQIADALTALHKHGIIHRDVHPANIIVSENPAEDPEENGAGVTDGKQFKVIDLGLAKLSTDDPKEKTPFALIYSPPEQIMNCGEIVNETSDIYSLAISLYECITGEIPFHHSHPEMMMQLMINVSLEPDKKISNKLFDILRKATSKYKFPLPPNKYKRSELISLLKKGQEGRYQSAEEFKMGLENILSK